MREVLRRPLKRGEETEEGGREGNTWEEEQHMEREASGYVIYTHTVQYRNIISKTYE